MVDPHIRADVADLALCDEDLCPREKFDVEEDYLARLSLNLLFSLIRFCCIVT